MMAHNIIPALGSPRREDHEFEASLGCAVRPSLKENFYKLACVVMHTFDPGIREAETVRDLDEFKDSKGHVERPCLKEGKQNLKPTIITFRSQFSSVLGTHSTPGSNK